MFELNESAITEYVQNPNAFTIELTDEIWKTFGYTTKGNCIRTLKTELITDVDYVIRFDKNSDSNGFSVRPTEVYTLSYNALKLLAASSPGKLGREYRRQLVELETKVFQGLKERTAQKQLTGWKQARKSLTSTEMGYRAWCSKQGFSANHTTNAVYLALFQMKAEGLRKLDTIDGNPTVAANHIQETIGVEMVDAVKARLTCYARKFSDYKTAVITAVNDLGI
jgi:hypothetical protein